MDVTARVRAEAGNAAHLRRLNLERVLALIMDLSHPFTRTQLVEATGLSAPTVGSLVTQLARSGLVRHLGTGPSQGGRRPASLAFNARHGFVAGIDLGSVRTRLAVADLRGEPLAQREMATPAGLGPAALLIRVADALKALLREANVPERRLLAVGAAAPGAVDQERGLVTLAMNLPGWSSVPMAGILRQSLRAPAVVENDVNLAILAERWKGAARGHDTCAFVSVGVGIGAGVVVGGELHRGRHFLAGEIAFMCLGLEHLGPGPNGPGKLEDLAGLHSLAARWPGRAGKESDRWVEKLFAAAENGDRVAREAVLEAAALIGIATANLSLVLDPSLVVFGGSVGQGDLLVREVRKVVERIVPSPPEIVISTLGKEAPLWGSLLVATAEAREGLRRRLADSSPRGTFARPRDLPS